MAKVNLQNISKNYGAVDVVHGFDLAISDGEFIVIVGPSGCGKSTILRMIAGLEDISSGKLLIDDKFVNDVPPKDRNIAMVFQNYALYPHMTVYNNMAYGLRMRSFSKQAIHARVSKTAEILELQHLLDRRPRALSGGQRQRVAMGRAMVRQPSLFLFDEPLSNLDAKLRMQMRLEIKKLQGNLGTTSIYVTHDQVEAMTLADRIVVVNNGMLEQIGTPMELYRRPASQFVAGFIGSPTMNFLNTTLLREGQSVRLANGNILELPRKPSSMLGSQPDIIVGVRPEHVVLVDDGEPVQLSLSVLLVERLGADTLVHGKLAGCDEMFAVRLEGHVLVNIGDSLPLRLSSSFLHCFDPATGKRC